MSRRKRKSNSAFGLLVLEFIALAVFFMLFNQARNYRQSQMENVPQGETQMTDVSGGHYQMIESNPLQALLASNQASY